jgi:uncharacterized protein (TIGR02266 family)
MPSKEIGRSLRSFKVLTPVLRRESGQEKQGELVSKEFANKRNHPRVDAVFQVRYEDVSQLADYTENLCEDGVFIATWREFKPGEVVMFELSFPGLVKPIHLSGEVIWRRSAESLGDLQSPGIGVRFNFRDDTEQQWLGELLRKLGAKGPAKAVPSAKEGKSFVILIAEDNPKTLTLYLQALQQTVGSIQISSIGAADETQAWKELQQRQVDLLVIEWRLCSKVGFDILQLIRSSPSTAKLSIVVIGSDEDEQKQALTASADVFLRRPVPAKGLLNTIISQLGSKAV